MGREKAAAAAAADSDHAVEDRAEGSQGRSREAPELTVKEETAMRYRCLK